LKDEFHGIHQRSGRGLSAVHASAASRSRSVGEEWFRGAAFRGSGFDSRLLRGWLAIGPDTLQPEKGAAPQLRLRVVRSLRPTADREAEPVAQRAHRSRDAREVRGSSPEFARETGAAAMDEAIHSLPERERQFLQRYLHGSRGSERKLATATGLSRYAVREQVVRVIGKVIAGFGQPPRGEYADWRVAEAIWLDDRTIDETAALLGLTAEAVKRARAHNVEKIVEALRRFESKRGGGVMASTVGGNAPIAVETLLYRALTNPGNEALLAELRARSSEIVDYLDTHDFVLPGTTAESVGELRIAEVYEAIASGSTSAATFETEQFTRELFQASQEDLASIGVAFKETLLPDLPVALVRFEDWFGQVPRAADEEYLNLLKQPDVMAAFPNSAELAVYGMTPSMFYFATEAVSGLLDRLIRTAMHEPRFVLKENTPLEVRTEEGGVRLPPGVRQPVKTLFAVR
jgi:hypothetical protein